MGLFDGGGGLLDTIKDKGPAAYAGLVNPSVALPSLFNKEISKFAGLTGDDVAGPKVGPPGDDIEGDINDLALRTPGQIQQESMKGIRTSFPDQSESIANTQQQLGGGRQFASSDAIQARAKKAFDKDLVNLQKTAEFNSLNQHAANVTKAANYRSSIRNIQRNIESNINNINMQQDAARAQVLNSVLGSAGQAAGYAIGRSDMNKSQPMGDYAGSSTTSSLSSPNMLKS